MINYDTPYTYENSENPWLMDTKDLSDIIEINGNKISAEFLWSLNKEEREKYLTLVFNYYRQHGFPYENISDAHIMNQFYLTPNQQVSSQSIQHRCLSFHALPNTSARLPSSSFSNSRISAMISADGLGASYL